MILLIFFMNLKDGTHKMKKLILILLILSPLASACDYINLGFKSFHFKTEGLNENNIGLGCENVLKSGVDVIVFKNSFNDVAGSASIFLPVIESERFNLGAQVGIMLGYDASRLFLITPRAEFVFDRFGFDFFLIPEGMAAGFKVKI